MKNHIPSILQGTRSHSKAASLPESTAPAGTNAQGTKLPRQALSWVTCHHLEFHVQLLVNDGQSVVILKFNGTCEGAGGRRRLYANHKLLNEYKLRHGVDSLQRSEDKTIQLSTNRNVREQPVLLHV